MDEDQDLEPTGATRLSGLLGLGVVVRILGTEVRPSAKALVC